MKKLLLFFIFLTFLSQISFAEIKDNKFNKQLQKIKKETQACLDSSDGGYQAGLCEYESIKKYDTFIKNIVNKLVRILSEEQKTQLILSQEKWNSFINQENNLINKTIDFELPYMAYTNCALIKSSLYKNRAEELFNIYHTYLYLKDENIIK